MDGSLNGQKRKRYKMYRLRCDKAKGYVYKKKRRTGK